MPSPVMEEPVRRILGLTQKQFENVLAGRERMPNGKTGPQGIHESLSNLNIDQEIARAQEMIASGKRSKRDEAVRKLKYLQAAQRLDIHPKQWLLSKVPVLPPAFRPVSQLGEKKLPMVADANFLYKALLDAKDNYTGLEGKVADLGDERLAIYNAFKAVTGLGDPTHPKLVEKNVRGLLAGVFGSSPKHGAVQRALLSNTVDLVGRGVVIPNPDLDMDSIGIPENKAWELYRFFTIRRLRRKGMPLTDAIRNVREQTPLARKELLAELDERPVRMVRAPVLHKFGIMAFKPRLVKGHGIQVSPLIVKPYGMDFDGDAVQYHVAATDDEKDEAMERLLPSKNLLSPANFKTPAYQPSQEYVGGLYTASAGESQNKPRRVFATAKDAWRAFQRGEISITDPINILKQE
jgi:DNA-directed RNA polymerase subunit beta'